MFWPIAGPLLVLLAATVGVELVGVARKGKGDTITEATRAARDRLPKPLRMVARWGLAGFGLWIALHLGFDLV